MSTYQQPVLPRQNQKMECCAEVIVLSWLLLGVMTACGWGLYNWQFAQINAIGRHPR